jgi:alpha,alpha-trehalose phosphorylase
MIHRPRQEPLPHVYPPDEWQIIEREFMPSLVSQGETIFSLSNGYLGMRGCFDEGGPIGQNGTFINGFYESWPIVYPETAYGLATTGQTMLNVTDTKIIKLYVDDEVFWLPHARLLNFERRLDLRAGTLDRDIVWETPAGKHVSIKSRRLVSFTHRHLAAISYQITILNADAPITISSEMIANGPSPRTNGSDPRQGKVFARKVLRAQQTVVYDHRMVLCHATKKSRMILACGVDHRLEGEKLLSWQTEASGDVGRSVLNVEGRQGKPVTLYKYITYQTSRTAQSDEMCARAERTLDRAVQMKFAKLLEEQRTFLDAFWASSDIEIIRHPVQTDCNPVAMQQAVRFNLFHVIQAAARAEQHGIPAKGLTGQAYEGHYFWDTEIYVVPFLLYTAPQVAKNVLRFRYGLLDMARKRARELNQKGAMFPWRTINGEEASAFFEAGTAQYHINADIMYMMKKYVEITGDLDFLFEEGAEMLIETARLWHSLGHYAKALDDRFCIHGVTGPDEYNVMVDNNAYTNLMARENLRYATASLERIQRERPDRFERLVHKTQLRWEEVLEWNRAADQMYVPYDHTRAITAQDSHFLEQEPWPFAHVPREKYPLLLFFHPLTIYRYQVLKQADVILAMLLLPHEFSPELKQRNFQYYDDLTTGDSSLSPCIQSIMAAEVGDIEKAEDYARVATLMDLGNVAGNVKDGCHIAAMGGVWMLFVYGFAGLRDYGGQLRFDPRVPPSFEKLRFHLIVGERLLEVSMTPAATSYRLRRGDELSLWHEGKEVHLSPGAPSVTTPNTFVWALSRSSAQKFDT